MEKNKIIILFLTCLTPLISLAQKIELEDETESMMSIPYFFENNKNSIVVLNINDIKEKKSNEYYIYELNAINWVYNDQEQLWIETECLDWSTAECCECHPTKIASGWINVENIKPKSLFSKFLKPFTLEMINSNNFNLINKDKRIAFPNEGLSAIGYGGTLLIYNYDKIFINVKGEMVILEKYQPSNYPSRENNEFKPYAYFESDYIDFKIKLFYENHKIPYIEIIKDNEFERIILKNVEWIEYGY